MPARPEGLMTRRGFGAFFTVMLAAISMKLERIDGALNAETSSDRAHIHKRSLFDFASGAIRLTEAEREHLHTCDICQRAAWVLIQSNPFPHHS